MKDADLKLEDLPPSAKLVYKVLEYNSGLTQKELREETRLSQRTVRDALDRLEERNAIEKNLYVPDGRQNLYEIATTSPTKTAEATET